MKRLILITLLIIGPAAFTAHAQTVKTMQLDAFAIPSGGQVKTLRLWPHTESGTCAAGTLYFDSSEDGIKICNNAGVFRRIHGVWTQNSTDVYLTDPTVTAVGIGTTNPGYALDVQGDGAAVFQGTFGAGPLMPAGAGTRLVWNPGKAAFRVGGVSGTQWDEGNVGNYSIGGGRNVTIDADYSVAFGDGNFIHSADPNSVISGGKNNAINHSGGSGVKENNTIGGGIGNTIDSERSTISGGGNNHIDPGTARGTIGGGENNQIRINTSGGTIGGGIDNIVDGFAASVVAGGDGNTATGSLAGGAAVGGGSDNVAGGAEAGVFAGDTNRAWADQAFVGGGIGNDNESPYGVIGGGWYNKLGKNFFISTGGTIGGGLDNVVDGDVGGVLAPSAGTIGGGQKNIVSASWGTIAGGGSDIVGEGNTVTARYASIGGGRNNDATALYAVISGGQNNVASATHSVIPGGLDNIAAGDYSWAGGRNMQLDAAADNTFVWGHNATPVAITTPNAFIIYSGNVGIGATNPTHTLHVNAVMKLEPQATAPACDASGLLYADTSGTLCFCPSSGGSWVVAAGSGTCS